MGAVDCCTNDRTKDAEFETQPRTLLKSESNMSATGPRKLDRSDKRVDMLNRMIEEAKKDQEKDLKTVFYKHQMQFENLEFEDTW